MLEEAGHVARISHKSFLDQGIELIPTIHVGVSATSMERRGIQTERGGHNDFYLTVRREIAAAVTVKRFEDYMAKEKTFADKRIREHAAELAELERRKPLLLLGLKKDAVRQWQSACEHQRRFSETEGRTGFHDIEAREAQHLAKLSAQDAERYTEAKEINVLLGEIRQKTTGIVSGINARQHEQEQGQKKSLGRGR